MRTFESGATRDTDQGKLNYAGFLSPEVIERYALYLHKHRIQADGKVRDADNWKKGIPKKVYIESMFRHFMDVWKEYEGLQSRDGLQDGLCGLLFNTMGYLFEDIKEQRNAQKQQADLSGNESALPEVYP